MYNKCAKLQRVEEIWVTNKLLSEFEITSDE